MGMQRDRSAERHLYDANDDFHIYAGQIAAPAFL
jgi:hypothetical protein